MPQQPFLAMISPLTGESLPSRPVDPGYGVDVGGHPTHPIVLPEPGPIPPEPTDPLPAGYKYAYAYSPQWRMWGWGAFKVGDQTPGGGFGGPHPSHPISGGGFQPPPATPKF